MQPRFEKLYAKKYPPDAYRHQVRAMVWTLQQRYGLGRRQEERVELEQTGPADGEQVGFAW
jgi:hypothetical protein